MKENGLEALFNLIKRQKWENLFKRKDLMYVAASKEFYKNLTVSISKKKKVAKSCIHGVKIKLDGVILTSILGVPGNNGICEYIKDVWKDSTYCEPLEITKKFVNDDLITVARRLKREYGVWWLGIGVNKRRDEDENAPTENEENVEMNEEEAVQEDFDLVQVDEEAKLQGEHIEKQTEKEAEKAEDSGSGEKFYDAMDDERLTDEDVTVPNVVVPADPAPQVPTPAVQLAKKRTDSGVDPLRPSGSLPNFVLQHLCWSRIEGYYKFRGGGE
ncbi:hypothetical protein Dimus_016600 [Dionaea muscipula]